MSSFIHSYKNNASAWLHTFADPSQRFNLKYIRLFLRIPCLLGFFHSSAGSYYILLAQTYSKSLDLIGLADLFSFEALSEKSELLLDS